VKGTTWLVVAAVAGLGLVATVDAVRDDGKAPQSAPKAQTPGPNVSQEQRIASRLLRDQAIRGTLVYRDRRCRLHAVSLPDLEEQPTPQQSGCRFTATRGNPLDFTPRCRRGATGIPFGDAVERISGCHPAWKPNGVLTLLRGGELVQIEVARSEQGDIVFETRVILSRADLRRALSRNPWALTDPVLREVVWLDNDLAAVVARERGENDHVFALFRGTRLVAAPPFPYPRLVNLRASPFGSYVAARFAGGQGLIMLDDRGNLVSAGIRTAHAVTWSPDEVWTALATDDGVFVFPTGERAIQLIRIPIAARDLVWR
jgi:hypothetical protein